MKGHLSSLMFSVLFAGGLLTTLMWYKLDNKNMKYRRHLPKMKIAPRSTDSCKNCGESIKKALEISFKPWKKQEDNFKKFRFQLSSKCNGFDKAIITQTNTPLGSKLVYDGQKKTSLQVKPEIFSTFPKGHPFSNKTKLTCAVVGNGGILANSRCGKMIDSAEFVIRCNLPPVTNGHEKHVGSKTNLVTSNPSILLDKYRSLMERRRPLIEKLSSYGDSMLLLPAFSYSINTPVCMRALYTVQDFESPIRPVFLNPQYLESLDLFWRSQGWKASRLSTGIMMTSLALELCDNVHLFGFWPFSVHPHTFQDLTHHYYDNKPAKSNFHAMPTEFNLLLQLHSQGVLQLHLGDCEPDYY
ncbi:PREDICTED: alpha-2,8-sialyltransferase 8F-like [Cyprinodon variegatus]|uniref:alpha-2,8-sialyltransferase 8F-like n=1 Tax=Cyprinodon variegatus TaxID=28743 RepID=UPI000742BB25|nr:PREDICTED: alpha-2,8-sialyltransferase 8F-like [Cyprinodon variegatus]